MSARVTLALLAALITATTACAAAPEPQTAAAPAGSGSTSTPEASVPEILDFEATLLSGGTLEGSSLAGQDLALWFWAPW